MKCPVKQVTFTTDSECGSDCAWYVSGECAVTLIAKGNKLGVWTDDGNDTEISCTIIRDTIDTGDGDHGGPGGNNSAGAAEDGQK